MNKKEINKRVSSLKSYVEELLSDIDGIHDRGDIVLFHQDAFAGDYQDSEYLLLGMFIKYVGLSGKEIRIIGKNRETIDRT